MLFCNVERTYAVDGVRFGLWYTAATIICRYSCVRGELLYRFYYIVLLALRFCVCLKCEQDHNIIFYVNIAVCKEI